MTDDLGESTDGEGVEEERGFGEMDAEPRDGGSWALMGENAEESGGG